MCRLATCTVNDIGVAVLVTEMGLLERKAFEPFQSSKLTNISGTVVTQLRLYRRRALFTAAIMVIFVSLSSYFVLWVLKQKMMMDDVLM
jgi:hypothetical protein